MSKKLTPEQKKIEKSLASAKASMAIEGFEVADEEVELGRKHLSGEISEEELFKIIKRQVLVSYSENHNR